MALEANRFPHFFFKWSTLKVANSTKNNNLLLYYNKIVCKTHSAYNFENVIKRCRHFGIKKINVSLYSSINFMAALFHNDLTLVAYEICAASWQEKNVCKISNRYLKHCGSSTRICRWTDRWTWLNRQIYIQVYIYSIYVKFNKKFDLTNYPLISQFISAGFLVVVHCFDDH